MSRLTLGLGLGGVSITIFMKNEQTLKLNLPEPHLQSSTFKCPHEASTKAYFHNCASRRDHSKQPLVSISTGKASAPLLKQYFVMVLGGL